jgi:hypothetical protein
VTDHENLLQWLALGAALGSRELLSRVLAELDQHSFDRGPARRLWEALAEGKDAVRKQLQGLGGRFPGDTKALDAVLLALQEIAARERQRILASNLAMAAKVMPPEQWRAYAAEQLGQMRQQEQAAGQVAGKIVAEG